MQTGWNRNRKERWGFRAVLLFVTLFPSTIIAQEKDPETSAGGGRSGVQMSRFWLDSTDPLAAKRWETPSDEATVARVIEITDKVIIFQTPKESATSRSSVDLLQAIDVAWATEKAKLAHQQYLRKELPSFVATAKEAISSGKVPQWQQRFLACEMADAIASSGKWETAGNVFISIVAEVQAPIYYSYAPLQWGQSKSDLVKTDTAKTWLENSENSFARLLGASWLIGTSKNADARSVLEDLVREKKQPIANLASCQLWRLATPNEVASGYKNWQLARDKMIVPLQSGPTIALARKLQAAGMTEQANQEWIRMATIARPKSILATFAHEQIVQSLTDSNTSQSTIESIHKLFQSSIP